MQREYSGEAKEMTPKQEALLREILESEELLDSESQRLRKIFKVSSIDKRRCECPNQSRLGSVEVQETFR